MNNIINEIWFNKHINIKDYESHKTIIKEWLNTNDISIIEDWLIKNNKLKNMCDLFLSLAGDIICYIIINKPHIIFQSKIIKNIIIENINLKFHTYNYMDSSNFLSLIINYIDSEEMAPIVTKLIFFLCRNGLDKKYICNTIEKKQLYFFNNYLYDYKYLNIKLIKLLLEYMNINDLINTENNLLHHIIIRSFHSHYTPFNSKIVKICFYLIKSGINLKGAPYWKQNTIWYILNYNYKNIKDYINLILILCGQDFKMYEFFIENLIYYSYKNSNLYIYKKILKTNYINKEHIIRILLRDYYYIFYNVEFLNEKLISYLCKDIKYDLYSLKKLNDFYSLKYRFLNNNNKYIYNYI